MALLVCPDCNGKVSERAEFCPHCGCPIALILEAASVLDKRTACQKELHLNLEHKCSKIEPTDQLLMQALGLVATEEPGHDDADEEITLDVCDLDSKDLDANAWSTKVPKFSTPCSLERKLFEILRDECLNGPGMATLTFLAHNARAFESDARAVLSKCSWATYQYGKYRLHDDVLAHKDALDKMRSIIPNTGWRHPRIKLNAGDEDDMDENIAYIGSSQNFIHYSGVFDESGMLEEEISGADEISFDDLESDYFEADSYDSDDFD